jgi:hypothetical protein
MLFMSDPNKIIDSLGGTSAVAKMFSIKIPSVCDWRHNGIPPARLMYLKVVRPDLFIEDEKPKLN